jgi:hypothetical protein
VPTAPGFEAVLQRMYQRDGQDALPAHLEQARGITVARMSRLDVGVFRVDRGDGGIPLVARLFAGARPFSSAEADLAVLRYLAEIDFPAERPFGSVGVTNHQGQAVLVTEFVKQVPRAKRPSFPIVALGAIIGRLHGLAVPIGADRPAGALHHFAEGTMADELRAVAGWVDSIEPRVPGASSMPSMPSEPRWQALTVGMAWPQELMCMRAPVRLSLVALVRSERDQLSGRSAKVLFMLPYQSSDFLGCRQRLFIASRACRWVASPVLSASLRCRSWALMTSSAVSPWCSRSHGPPSWRQVIVFIARRAPSLARCWLLCC